MSGDNNTMAKNANSKLFGETVDNKSATQYLQETMEFGQNEEGVMVVSFALCGGKGTSRQTVPLDQFESFVGEFTRLSNEGIDRVESARTASEQLRQSVAINDDGLVQFRVGSGKGVKPTHFSPTEFAEVATLLNKCVALINKKMKK
jgi:hypothetical protein